MCGYHCPFAERKPCAGFLLCRKLFRDGVNYNDRKNAVGVICAFQKPCERTGRMENTENAKACYEARMAAQKTSSGPLGAASPDAEPDAGSGRKPAPKKRGKKAKND